MSAADLFQHTVNIHGRLLKKLLLVWLALSLSIGTAVYYEEMRRMDSFVVDLSLEESGKLVLDNRDYLNSKSPADLDTLSRRVAEYIKNGHFIIVEIYDKAGKQVAEAIGKESASIENQLDGYKNELPIKGKAWHKKYTFGKQSYLVSLNPIELDGATIGYFKGVYRVDKKTLDDIEKLIAWSLVAVMGISLVTMGVMYPVIISMNKGLAEYSAELSKANIGMIKVLGEAIAKRDCDTGSHNYRVAIYATRLAEEIRLDNAGIRGLIKGAFLHDVGKIAISDTILLKSGKLTDKEFAIMKGHVSHGADIAVKYRWLNDALEIIRFHHEKFDGSGYPYRLRINEIPLNARIFSIVDVFDALTSDRPYKEAFPLEMATDELEKGRSTHFDPTLLDAFLRIAGSLHTELYRADEEKLEGILDTVINRYFNETASTRQKPMPLPPPSAILNSGQQEAGRNGLCLEDAP